MPATPISRHVPDARSYTLKEHKSVMFSACPNCRTGRVMWGGDRDTRWMKITGIRGACLLCPFEVYTKDLLQSQEIEHAAAFLRGVA